MWGPTTPPAPASPVNAPPDSTSRPTSHWSPGPAASTRASQQSSATSCAPSSPSPEPQKSQQGPPGSAGESGPRGWSMSPSPANSSAACHIAFMTSSSGPRCSRGESPH
ncbi:hypothetical protein HMPREF9153_0801 [Cutibacterium avidum ATCC 25577]|uniref:Uncharacterized protein n=1 Tax=Cutibacterium avidum ATCC 25577 TaxID=997355 RepID=G4CW94_9ACTN|nr:hypothetical protein HMPREF9153_0801 [Cutibacterium avidum ATCC 25577]